MPTDAWPIYRFDGESAFLSNFYPLPNGLTLEHYYQAAKTLDPSARAAILCASTPGRAKRLGQHTPLRPHWNEMRVNAMRALLRRKFADLTLAAHLLATGERPLVEGNTWHDNFWGICYCSRCDARGENWLGRLLMEIRAELKEDEIGG